MTRLALIPALAAVALAGCEFDGRLALDGPPHNDGGDPDARVDAMPGDPCLDWQFMPAEFDPCAIPQPTNTGPIDISAGDWTLDGGTGVLTDGVTSFNLAHMALDGIAVVSVDHLNVTGAGTLRGIGTLPLAIVSWHDADISGTIDVSSHRDNLMDPPTSLGAGANPVTCPDGSGGLDGPTQGQNDGAGDGGSGGGGYGDKGGDGGDGGGGNGGNGGDGRPLPARIEGGCPGAAAPSGMSGIGGAGGGAVLVVAKGTLTISGVIHAGGQGGGGALAGGSEAGGGGGSGGMIKVEAANLTITQDAILAANGGQGGGGNHNMDALPGEDGQATDTAAFVTNKEGGGTSGGAGGFVGSTQGDTAANAGDGGGGGGGGVGYIVYRGHLAQVIDSGATFSPDGAPF